MFDKMFVQNKIRENYTERRSRRNYFEEKREKSSSIWWRA